MNRSALRTVLLLVPALAGGLSQAQTTERVSAGAGGVQGDDSSFDASISADGRFVAFESRSTNLVAGDSNGFADVFVCDRVSGTIERVSVDSAGAQGNADSGYGIYGTLGVCISADGRSVAFLSYASNLVAGDTNGVGDIFVRDRQLGTTKRVSVDSGGTQGNGFSEAPSLSADGRFVAFRSAATNLVPGDTNLAPDIFVRDLMLGTIERVSVSSGGTQGNMGSGMASISGSGRFVAFTSRASNLDPADGNMAYDVFVRDRLNGTTELASVDSAGYVGFSDSYIASISADGRFVAFGSWSSNLVPGDSNAAYDIFVHDRQTGITERVSVDSSGVEANNNSPTCAISADARFVAFESFASNLVPGDSNGSYDAFVRDRQSGTTERVSVDSLGAQGNGWSRGPAISADGRIVAFASLAPNLVSPDTNATWDAFVRDRGAPAPIPFCSGDGTAGACPCGNTGASGSGCENSASTGGARLAAAGNSSLAGDTLLLTSSGELPSALSIFLQGSSAIAPAHFGDGLRCAGGVLKRLYTRTAVGGIVRVPQPGDLSISARSAALGDTLGAGSTRHYQTYYRDPLLGFCAAPAGNTWNISSGVSLTWMQ